MSAIEKLTIRGIRNFGTDQHDEQKLIFTSPLTLIIGENGCGKTTIIECIKYALTNQYPPNCANGNGFVNDPDVHHMNESTGQVKLLVRNLQKENVTVSRMCKATKTKGKKSKTTFKSVDQTVQFDTGNGPPVTIHYTSVAEVNQVMCNALGVSEAIINNVLFCHQEDSSWPLGTDKELKEKFDAIFGTTKYNKAVDNIRSKRKKFETEEKKIGEGLKHKRFMKEENESETMKLQNLQEKFDNHTENIDEYEAQMKPIHERLVSIDKLRRNIAEIYGKKSKLDASYTNVESNIKSLRSKIKEVFLGSELLLAEEMQTFQNEKSTTAKRLESVREELRNAENAKSDLEAEQSKANTARALMRHKRGQEQDLYGKRYMQIVELCEILNIPVDDELENNDQRQEEFMKKIAEAIRTEDETLEDLTLCNEGVERDLQSAIDKLREERTAVNSQLAAKEQQCKELEVEKKNIEAKIKESKENQSKLADIKVQISGLDASMKQIEDAFNFDEMKGNIANNRSEAQELRAKLNTIDREIKFFVSISTITADISSKEKQLEMRGGEIRRLKNKHLSNLQFLFENETVENGFKRRLDALGRDVQDELTTIENNIKSNQQELTELQINSRNKKNELKGAESEINRLEIKVEEQCQSTPYEELLEVTRDKKSKLEFEYGTLKSEKVLFEKYIQNLSKQPCCPLCHKDMNGNEITELKDELQDQIGSLPTKLKGAERNLKEETVKLEKLLALKSVVERLTDLKDKEIHNLKSTVTDLDTKLAAAKVKKTELDEALEMPLEKRKKIHSIGGDMTLLDKAIEEQNRLQQEIDNLKKKIPQSNSNSTMEEEEIKREETNKALTDKQHEIDEEQKTYDYQYGIYCRLRDAKNNAVVQKNNLEGRAQEVTQHIKRVQEITNQTNGLQDDTRKMKDQLRPLENKLQQAIDNRVRTVNENKQKWNVQSVHLKKIQRMENDVKRCSEDIHELAKQKLAEQINEKNKEIEKRGKELEKKVQECQGINERIEKLKKEQINQESVERNLQDNLELKKLEKQMEELKGQIEVHKKEMENTDIEELERERKKLEKNLSELNDAKSVLKGVIQSLALQIEELKKKLQKPDYKNSGKNYREAFHEHKILQKVIQDMNKYCKALERALLQYHSDKMTKINGLIKEFWRSIYRGNDIDYIQIQTEVDTGASAAKRSYNYRVVQTKNDVDLDMRGRCSAGQRVLACLIIRIALAETFSSHCGVLALDEPTTNLDRANIESLCLALNRIVEERENQSNFMLVIITHDKDFIQTLKGLENYYEVSRNAQSKSTITKVVAP